MSKEKTRKHTVLLTVYMDKPCTDKEAAAMAKDCIYGTYYPEATLGSEVGSFKVKTIKHIPEKMRTCR